MDKYKYLKIIPICMNKSKEYNDLRIKLLRLSKLIRKEIIPKVDNTLTIPLKKVDTQYNNCGALNITVRRIRRYPLVPRSFKEALRNNL